uniref:RhuM family protein n=1 Tax=Prevotella sp. TaxID=59823 RepID=UPI0040294E71
MDKNSVCRNFRRTAADGKSYNTQYYNLDAIISVGYRANSCRFTQFRLTQV